ncbi:MAG: mannose-1-phosphate guanylyltransferase [Deltaproteobacteria bacterium]|nr:mannose-1-phosphate guanylyltransferase [Deltaproteobacteria bacterium]
MFVVIMAGGAGTRFWPRSRRRLPKQFLNIVGERPLLRAAVDNAIGADGDRSRLLVVAGSAHRPLVERCLPDVPPANLLYEPVGRNTAPAIGFACVEIARRDARAVAAVLPSDHVIGDPPALRAALAAAASAAADGAIVTIGIQPTRPETGYGYIARGEQTAVHGGQPVYRVSSFVEKPGREQAERYLAAGNYFWNAGMFVFRVDAMLAAIRAHMPELAAGLQQLAEALGRGDSDALARLYPALPAQSIDYGVMERVENAAMVPASCGWSDVGSWAALPEVQPLDAAGNAVSGDALLVDTAGSVVDARAGRLVAVLGCRDLVVVDTEDALLVVPRERAQEVRQVLALLESDGRTRLL